MSGGGSYSREGSGTCRNCHIAGHYVRECPLIVCRRCGRSGHFQDACPASASASRFMTLKRHRSDEDHDDMMDDGDDRRSHFYPQQEQQQRLHSERGGGGSGFVYRPSSSSSASASQRQLDHSCFHCGSLRHIRSQCPEYLRMHHDGDNDSDVSPRGSSRSSSPPQPFRGGAQMVKCFNCGHEGHLKAHCPKPSLQNRCFHCCEPGHLSNRCPYRSEMGDVRLCYHCHLPGHMAGRCPQKFPTPSTNNKQQHPTADISTTTSSLSSGGGVTTAATAISTPSPSSLGPTSFSFGTPDLEDHNRRSLVDDEDHSSGAAVAAAPLSSSSSAAHRRYSMQLLDDGLVFHHQAPTTTTIPSTTRMDREAATERETQQHQQREEEEHRLLQRLAGLPPPAAPPTAAPVVAMEEEEAATGNGGLASEPTAICERPTTSPPPDNGSGASVTNRFGAAAAAPPAAPQQQQQQAWQLAPFEPSSGGPTIRRGRLAVVIDGSYFERCCVAPPSTGRQRDAAHYSRCKELLKYTLDFLATIFEMNPIAYWFDTDPSSFATFVENHCALSIRDHILRESDLRRRHLTDAMNGGKELPNVVSKLVGGMKRQKGFAENGVGVGGVWVQTGVDVSMATCVIECFQDRRSFQQVVLLSGDSDLYPCVHYCNSSRRSLIDASSTVTSSSDGSNSNNNNNSGPPPPVRVCGTSGTISKVFGQHQDLSDFLPRILLDEAVHREFSPIGEEKVVANRVHNFFR